MYFVWLWGCNKFEPKLILCGKDLTKIKRKLKKRAECEHFTDLIAPDRIAQFDEDWKKRALHGKKIWTGQRLWR